MPTVIVPITHEGAVIEVLIAVSAPRAVLLAANQQQTPQPISARLLIDTGASNTNVQDGLLAPLGLTPTGSIPTFTPTTGNVPVNCDQYDVTIIFPNAIPFGWQFQTVPVIECKPLTGSIQGLLGRDILNRCVLTYNPFSPVVTLSF
jgi:hypothetical protein